MSNDEWPGVAGCGSLGFESSIAPFAEWEASCASVLVGCTAAGVDTGGDFACLPFLENGTVPFFTLEVVDAEAARFDPGGVLSRKVPFFAGSRVEGRESRADGFEGPDGIWLGVPFALAAAVAAICCATTLTRSMSSESGSGTVPFFSSEVVGAEAARFDPGGVSSRKVPF